MGEFSPTSTFRSPARHLFYNFVVNSDGSVEFRGVAFQQTVAPLGKTVLTLHQIGFYEALPEEKGMICILCDVLSARTDCLLCTG